MNYKKTEMPSSKTGTLTEKLPQNINPNFELPGRESLIEEPPENGNLVEELPENGNPG